jgi:predicted enzyme related to lactoylglutathione lyase
MYQNNCNVTVMVKDMDRSVKFYGETLGLIPGMRFGNHWAEMKASGLTLGLHPMDPKQPAPAGGGNLSIGLGVKNLDEAMGKLREKGVSFDSPIVDDEAVRIAHFKDPDGTPLYICQSKW